METQTATHPPPSFAAALRKADKGLSRQSVSTVQVNIGKLCNQVCTHCHVDAGPNKKKENMDSKTVDQVLKLIDASTSVEELDLTGGAPELNPHFRRMVTHMRQKGKKVIDRCNLTVLFEEGQEDLAKFLADNEVQVVASLPCYSSSNVDKQRGDGVFDKSIRGLQLLNSLGYGKKGSPLTLTLVYNPLGPNLPPDQKVLEEDYRARLKADFGIEFTQLFTITNMPIKRFQFDLKRMGALDSYMETLRSNFNSSAVDSIMCYSTVSIAWDGKLYDCDFNQALDIPIANKPQSVWDLQTFEDLLNAQIATKDHCFGCTAGSGSSCKGALV